MMIRTVNEIIEMWSFGHVCSVLIFNQIFQEQNDAQSQLVLYRQEILRLACSKRPNKLSNLAVSTHLYQTIIL